MEDFDKTVREARAVCAAAGCTDGLERTADVNGKLSEIKAEIHFIRNLLWGLLVTFLMLAATSAGAMIFAWVSRGDKI